MTPRAVLRMAFTAAAFLGGLSTAAEAQLKSETGHCWIVRRHQDDPNGAGDIAARIEVTDHTISAAGVHKIKATMTRYDNTTGTGASKKYAQRAGDGGEVDLKGKITRNEPGAVNDDGSRKQIHFQLTGVYFDDSGDPHSIRVIAYYHTGNKKNSTTGGAITNRGDDRLCARIHDRPMAVLAAPAPGDPCDEQPPDEDVLTDETTTNTDPDYDP